MATTATAPAIQCIGVAKSYDDVPALRGIDLEVRAGEIFGFLGPNGAGKTTAIRCMLDLIRPTAGQILIHDVDPQRDAVAVRRCCGYLPGELNFDDNLTTRKLLRMLDTLRGGRTDWPFVDGLCTRLQLDVGCSIKNLSKGNKQKVGIIQAFMHRPDVLLLDEPTSGLDPLMQQEVLGLITEARDGGATVFLSSHILTEVQAIADRVGVVRDGRIVVDADTEEILQHQLLRVVVVFRDECPLSVLADIPGVRVLKHDRQREFHLQIAGDMDRLVKAIAAHCVTEIRAEPATLEDMFLAYFADQ